MLFTTNIFIILKRHVRYMAGSNSSGIDREYDELLKKAQSQPGVVDVMKAYGQYDELVKKTNAYFARQNRTKAIISSTGSSK